MPHDPAELIRLHGGKKRFTEHLDSCSQCTFPTASFAETEDITREGIIGNYVHGNEPSHHVPYLYNHAGAPKKTQYWVRYIMDHKYLLNGWIKWQRRLRADECLVRVQRLGFYPVAPGSDRYDSGSPLVKEATLTLENGNTFNVKTANQGPDNIYVRRAELNGTKLDRLGSPTMR
ncbi:MAG: glycoside hydrolase family 92 protein [Bacteroidales bacterium]